MKYTIGFMALLFSANATYTTEKMITVQTVTTTETFEDANGIISTKEYTTAREIPFTIDAILTEMKSELAETEEEYKQIKQAVKNLFKDDYTIIKTRIKGAINI